MTNKTEMTCTRFFVFEDTEVVCVLAVFGAVVVTGLVVGAYDLLVATVAGAEEALPCPN